MDDKPPLKGAWSWHLTDVNVCSFSHISGTAEASHKILQTAMLCLARKSAYTSCFIVFHSNYSVISSDKEYKVVGHIDGSSYKLLAISTICCISHILYFFCVFRLEYEYIVKGYMFQKGRLKITVSKIFKVSFAAFLLCE